MGEVSSQEKLQGRWTTRSDDTGSLDAYGNATLVFRGNELRYIVHSQAKSEIMILKYSVKDNILITTQPSSPREEETAFEIVDDKKLILNYNGRVSEYFKVS